MADYTVPNELKYSKTHEWLMDLGENKFRMGVTEYAAKHIGDVTYVELPEVDDEVDADDSICVVETVKSSEDVFNHISGVVIATNEDVLNDAPETVNNDCYGDGWLYTIQTEDDEDFNNLMSAEEYKNFLADLDD